MLTSIKPKLSKTIDIFAKPFVKVNPNILTLIGLLPPMAFFILLNQKQYIWAIIVSFGLFFDTLDGAVARMTGKESLFGKFFDSSLDRVSDAFYILAFGFSGIVRFEIVSIVLFLSIFISYLRTRAEAVKKESGMMFAVGIVERTERLILLLLALVLYIVFPNNWSLYNFNIAEYIFIILGILSFVTVVQRFLRAKEKLSE